MDRITHWTPEKGASHGDLWDTLGTLLMEDG